MSLDFLRSLVKSTGKDIIHKAAVEKIMDITFKNLKEEVLPSFSELLKVKPEHFNETVKLVMEKSLKKKDSKEQVKEYINIINFVLKNEKDIRNVYKDMPEHLPIKYISTKKAHMLSILTTVTSFTLSSLDIAILMVTKDTSDFSNSVITQMNSSMNSMVNLIPYIRDLYVHMGYLVSADDEININDDNIRLETILKSKGGLPEIPNMGFAFVGRAIYNIRTWLVDREIKKYEMLKVKKQYLLKKLLEIENLASNSPEDMKLKRAKEVYISEIEKINFNILKIETV
jgi:hypothetical protein